MEGIEKLERVIIIKGDARFYCKDPSLAQRIQQLMQEGKKFLATSQLLYGAEKKPMLIHHRGTAKYFNDFSYMIGDDPIPQIITAKVIDGFTVYEVDFI